MGQLSCPFLIMCAISIAGNENARAVERPPHWPHDALDGPMVLLHNVVEVFSLPQLDVRTRIVLDALCRSRVGVALVDGDFFTVRRYRDRTAYCAVEIGGTTL